MANIIFCNNCGKIIPEPEDKETDGKYFCDEECEFEYVYGLSDKSYYGDLE